MSLFGSFCRSGASAAIHFVLAKIESAGNFSHDHMRIKFTTRRLLTLVAALFCAPALHSATEEEMAAKMALLEKRLAELEARLADNEQETKEVKVLAANSTTAAGAANTSILGNAATFDILANSAWRNLRWTQEEQWAAITKGSTIEEVEEALGYPPRSVESLKPRVDLVYFYETSIRDRSTGMRGKISFKDGKVVFVQKPDFRKSSTAQ